MNIHTGLLVAAATAVMATAAAAATDTVQFPTAFFSPLGGEFDDPYYRSREDDWGWTHGAIAPGFTSASLNVSAFDVDFDEGEFDEIFVMDDGIMVSLGLLAGATDVFSLRSSSSAPVSSTRSRPGWRSSWTST